jgi:hypothetical protein
MNFQPLKIRPWVGWIISWVTTDQIILFGATDKYLPVIVVFYQFEYGVMYTLTC